MPAARGPVGQAHRVVLRKRPRHVGEGVNKGGEACGGAGSAGRGGGHPYREDWAPWAAAREEGVRGAPRPGPAEAEAGASETGHYVPLSHLRLAALGAVGRRRSRPPLRPLFEHRVLELAAQQPASSLHRAPAAGAPGGGGAWSSAHVRPDAERAGPPRPERGLLGLVVSCGVPQTWIWPAAGLELWCNLDFYLIHKLTEVGTECLTVPFQEMDRDH